MTSRFVEPDAPHAYINHHPLLPSSLTSALDLKYSFLGDLSPLPQLLSAIPIASTARTALARVGPPEPPLGEGPARDAGNQVFGERLDATARSLNDSFV
jgi:hypothetical protein